METDSDPHHEIESAFFEFCKMKAFLENGVTKRVADIPIVPIKEAQEYVYSLLLVDLISVFDLARGHFFRYYKLKEVKGKSQFTVMEERGLINNPRYLEWYKSWRNDAAHKLKRHQYHELRQATKDVGSQLKDWGLVTPKIDFWPYETTVENNIAKTGARVNEIIVLEFEVWSRGPGSGSSRKTIDLSWSDFKTRNPEIIRKAKRR